MPAGFPTGGDKAVKTVILPYKPPQFYILLNFGILRLGDFGEAMMF